MVAALKRAKEFAPPCGLDAYKPIVAPLFRIRIWMVRAFFFLYAVANSLRKPEWVPDAHMCGAGGDAVVVDIRIIRGGRVKNVSEEMSSEVGVCG